MVFRALGDTGMIDPVGEMWWVGCIAKLGGSG